MHNMNLYLRKFSAHMTVPCAFLQCRHTRTQKSSAHLRCYYCYYYYKSLFSPISHSFPIATILNSLTHSTFPIPFLTSKWENELWEIDPQSTQANLVWEHRKTILTPDKCYKEDTAGMLGNKMWWEIKESWLNNFLTNWDFQVLYMSHI